MKLRSVLASAGAAAALAAAVVALAGPSAQGNDNDKGGSWWRPPRDVKQMLEDVSAKNLKTDDLKLVGFGTRHTLSTQTDPNRGIGAAATGSSRSSTRTPRRRTGR